MRKIVLLGAATRAADQRAIGRADHQAAGFQKELMARLLFKFGPQFVGPLNERDVEGILEIGFANDSG